MAHVLVECPICHELIPQRIADQHVDQCLSRVAADAHDAENTLEEEEADALTFDDAIVSKLWGASGPVPQDWNVDGSTRHQKHAELAQFSSKEEHVEVYYSSIKEMRNTRPMESGLLYCKLQDIKGFPFDRDGTYYLELNFDGTIKRSPKTSVVGNPTWSEQFIFVSLG